ncbi:MAG: hypothetical protein HW413_2223 [Thermoleophilia bacterium]|nr:hypothetical protein [Thermoleophilia bacterium]
MYPMSGLFGDLRGPSSTDVMRGQSADLRQEVDDAPADHVLQAEAGAWADALAERYAIDVPTLDRAGITQDQPAQVKVRQYDGGSVPGVRYVVRVPFAGEADVFKYRPSSRLMGEISGKVVGGLLVFALERPESGRPVDLDQEVDRWLKRVEDHLEYWRKDVRDFQSRLRVVALEKIEARKRDLESIQAEAQASSIPIASSTGEKTYIPQAITRKPGRVRAGRRPTATPRIPLDPSLDDDVYEEIIESLRRGGRRMEKTPGTYRKLDEEERRDVLLTILNDGFTSSAGEAFNASGKTDLLVPFEDGNLFIGECKIWDGKESFVDAVDQLFGYRTWRDSKLALMIFVPLKGLTSVIKTARSALEEHEEFAGWIDHSHETELRCRVTWPGDLEKVGTLTVIFAHIPR